MRNTTTRLLLIGLAALVVGGAVLAGPLDYLQKAKLPPPGEQLYDRNDLKPDPGPIEILPKPIYTPIVIGPGAGSGSSSGRSADTGKAGPAVKPEIGSIAGGGSSGVGFAEVDPQLEAERSMRRLIRRLEG